MYKIIFPSAPSGELVLELRKGLSTAIAIVLFILGTPFFLAGLLLLTGDEFVRSGFFIAGIGLFLLCGGMLIVLNRTYPEKLIFDNVRGALRIIERKGDEAQIPYQEILDFHVGVARQKNAMFFTAEMEKKDGALWTLASYAGRSKAEEVVENLKKYVNLSSFKSAPTRSDGEAFALEGVNRLEKNGVTVIEWKQRFSLFYRFIGYAAIFSFALVLFGVAGWFRENIVGYYIALFVAAALLIYPAVYFLYSIRRIYVLEIGRGIVRYYTKGLFARGLSFSLPIDRVDSVIFVFSIFRAEMVIYFLSSEQRKRLLSILRGDVGDIRDIMDSISFMMHLPRIDAGGFTVSEKLKLEAIIQQAMREHGGKENL